MPDPTPCIRFSSVFFLFLFFQRRYGSYCAKQTRIRSGWPGQGLAKHIWSRSKMVCRNHPARFLAKRNLPATSFPLLDSVPFSTDVTDNIVQDQPGSDLVLADCVSLLSKRIRSGSKPMCKNHPANFWPVLPSQSGPDASRIRHVYWVGLNVPEPLRTPCCIYFYIYFF